MYSFLGDLDLVPPLLIGWDQTISIQNYCAVSKTCYNLLSQLCVQVQGSAFPIYCILHTALCCKHINEFKCIRLLILL